MGAVTAVNLHETAWVDDELEITPFYAGHVLGAAMFYVRVRNHYSVLYTGDYNMTPDRYSLCSLLLTSLPWARGTHVVLGRHLGAAHVNEKLRPDLLITESTCATFDNNPMIDSLCGLLVSLDTPP